jgi:hypothetical protein
MTRVTVIVNNEQVVLGYVQKYSSHWEFSISGIHEWIGYYRTKRRAVMAILDHYNRESIRLQMILGAIDTIKTEEE